MAKKKIDTPRSFAHDSNARNSAKIIKLRLAHGAAGYGVYFMLLERLRDTPDYHAEIDYEVLAYDLRETPELIRSVIEDFGLFIITDDGKEFHSPTMTARMTAQYAPAVPVAPASEPIAAPVSEPAPEPAPVEEAVEIAPVAEPEPAPVEETPTQTDLPTLIDRTCSDGQWLAEVARKYDCTTKYVVKKLRKEIHTYCLTAANPPASTADLRAIALDWFDGKI